MTHINKVCAECGATFFVPQAFHWQTLCRHCYRGEMDAREELRLLKEQVARLPPPRPRIGLDLRRWRQLLQLCHPDRHQNSKASTAASKWLLQIRGQIEK